MALFKRRKQNTDVLPAEVREYYQSERRERKGVAWMLALGTLLLTFVIAAALFFGGRWVYNVVFNNDSDKGSQETAQDEGLRVDENGNVVGGGSATQPTNGSNTPGTTQGTTGTSSTSTTTPSSGTNTPATTPNTGEVTPAELINTGPGDE